MYEHPMYISHIRVYGYGTILFNQPKKKKKEIISWLFIELIGLHVNADKTKFMCFNQRGDISTLNSSSLKLVDKFTYQGTSVLSTEKDINTRLTKVWTALDRQSVIWKSKLTHKIKYSFFFSSSGCVDTARWMHFMNANLMFGEKAGRQLHKNTASNIE